jgi:hypothetical protein
MDALAQARMALPDVFNDDAPTALPPDIHARLTGIEPRALQVSGSRSVRLLGPGPA